MSDGGEIPNNLDIINAALGAIGNGRHRSASAAVHSGSPETADTGDGAGDTYAATLADAYAAYCARAQRNAAAYNAGAGGMIGSLGIFGSFYAPPLPPMPYHMWQNITPGGYLVGGGEALAIPSEPEVENTGIEVGETIGWRCWTIRESGHLSSMMARSIWLPDEPMKADGVSARHGSGVHAFKTFDQAVDQYGCYGVSSTIVFGRVALWGEVVEFTQGYKGEYGYPASFDYLKPQWGHSKRERRGTRAELNEFRAMYGLPVVSLSRVGEGPHAGWRERAVQAFARMLRV